MPLTITLLGTATSTSNTLSVTDILPSPNSVLLVDVFTSDLSASPTHEGLSTTIGDVGAFTQWTLGVATFSGYTGRSLHTALVGPNPTTGDVTNYENCSRHVVQVFEITGDFDYADLLRQVATPGTSNTGSVTATFADAPAASSLVVASASGRDTDVALVTPPPGYTALTNVTSGSGDQHHRVRVAYHDAGPGTDQTWTDTGTIQAVAVGLEVKDHPPPTEATYRFQFAPLPSDLSAAQLRYLIGPQT